MKSKLCALALIAAILAPASFAQEDAATAKKGKGKGKAAQGVATQLLKQLEPAALTDEQTAKIKELGKKAADEIKKIETEAELTPEILKKRREAMASMKDSDKKGKERTKAVDAAAGLTEVQSAAFVKTNAVRSKLKAEAVKLLSDEQKAKLPEEFLATLDGDKAGAGKGGKKAGEKKGKKKEAATN